MGRLHVFLVRKILNCFSITLWSQLGFLDGVSSILTSVVKFLNRYMPPSSNTGTKLYFLLYRRSNWYGIIQYAIILSPFIHSRVFVMGCSFYFPSPVGSPPAHFDSSFLLMLYHHAVCHPLFNEACGSRMLKPLTAGSGSDREVLPVA